MLEEIRRQNSDSSLIATYQMHIVAAAPRFGIDPCSPVQLQPTATPRSDSFTAHMCDYILLRFFL